MLTFIENILKSIARSQNLFVRVGYFIPSVKHTSRHATLK